MDSIKSGFTQIIYPRSYYKTPQQQQAHLAFHQTSKDLDSSKLEHTWFNNLPLFDEDKSPILVLDLIESEAVPAKQSLSKAQYLWEKIRAKTEIVYQQH